MPPTRPATPRARRLVASSLLTVVLFGACYVPPPQPLDPATATDTTGDPGPGDPGPGDTTGDEPEPTTGVTPDCDELRDDARDVLEQRCADCHSGPAAKIFDYVTDLDRLLAEGKVAGGSPAESLLYQRIESDEMPLGGPPLSAGEKQAVRDWIEQCTVPTPDNPLEPPQCKNNEFITTEQMLKHMVVALNDPEDVEADDQPFIRFFTLTHLHNAGYCPEQLEAYRQALRKLLNSLSSTTKLGLPEPVDPHETILRVDLRDYGWDPVLWDFLMDRSPFAVEYVQQAAIPLKAGTQTAIPFHMADAFIADAARAPLYDEILYGHVLKLRSDVIANPLTRFELETFLGIDVAANIEQETIDDKDFTSRAGFDLSGVSEQNRVIERHDLDSLRGYWLSYDFASEAGFGDIFLHPLDFLADGGEIIFHLPNRMQAYLLVDKEGRRVDIADIQIVNNKEKDGEPIVNGLSCMGCHAAGTRPATDEVRDYVLDQIGVFDEDTRQKVKRLYAEQDTFKSLLEQDDKTYQDQLSHAKVALEVAGKELITIAHEGFEEQDLGLRRAAAELGLTEAQLQPKIGQLPLPLHLLIEQPIAREKFRNEYAVAICNLKLGITKACKPG
jgi:hypothetical protein